MTLSKQRTKALKKQQDKLLAGGSGKIIDLSNAKKERVRLAYVPEDEPTVFKKVGTHFVRGKPYTCVALTWEEPCAACKAAAELEASKKSRDRRIAELLKPRVRFLVRAIARRQKPPEVKVMQCPKSVFDAIWTAMTGGADDEDEAFEEGTDLLDTEKGRDIIINTTGSGMKKRYKAVVSQKSTPLHSNSKTLKRLLKEARQIDLETFPIRPKGLKKAVARLVSSGGRDEDEDEDEDDDLEPRRRKRDRSDEMRGKLRHQLDRESR